MNGYILIADDNEDARHILSEAVGLMGLDVEVAKDGVAALEMIREKPPVLILLDVMMPGFNGFQVLSRLRTNPETRDIPVIVISASGIGNLDATRLPGNTRVMPKASYDLKELRATISSMIDTDEETP